MPSPEAPGTVHLVQGFLGAGKTTFAARLARETNAVRLSVDELYLELFAGGPTYELDPRALARLFRVTHRIWPQIVTAGADVVLDFGFWKRSLRDEVRSLAAAAGAPTRHYFLRCPDETALLRCLERNGQPGAFLISEQGFRELLLEFEPPGDDELVEIVDSSVLLAHEQD